MIKYSKDIEKRAKIKLGEPVMTVELDESQMETLFVDSIKNWHLYSSLSKLEKEKLNLIENEWVENYFQALCKESLGRIRSKYSGKINIPGGEFTLEFESLFSESLEEKRNLISLLIPPVDKVVLAAYVEIGNLEESDVRQYVETIRKRFAINKNYEMFIIPVRGQGTSIECIYPNFSYDKSLKTKAKNALEKFIENINNEQ